MAAVTDRVGLAWRPELAHGLYQHLDDLDVLEVLADDWLADDRRPVTDLQAWAKEIPLHLHGTRLGLASAEPLDDRLLDRWASLLNTVRPAAWSEHLALTGAGGIRLPHFLAPPRTPGGVAAIAANLAQVRRVVGSVPLLENPASLVDPPASSLDEAAWLGAIATHGHLLLDLHNLYANAHNFPGDPLTTVRELLPRLPISRVTAVHLAGGRAWRGRWLDDHRHAVPDAVWTLLEDLAALGPGPLEVIIEWDGDYPAMDHLLGEVAEARRRLAAGRRQPRPMLATVPPLLTERDDRTAILHRFLVSVVADSKTLVAFQADPLGVATTAGIPQDLVAQVAKADLQGLEIAAASLTAKAKQRHGSMPR